MEALLDDTPQETQVVAASSKVMNFFDLTRTEFREILKNELGEPTYRADQVFEWVYRKRCAVPEQMSNVSKTLRTELEKRFTFHDAEIADRQISNDGTRKYLIRYSTGDAVESVMIKQPNRMTLCVSSQVGCGMGCAFCRTATMGFKRHLSLGEIVGQVRAVIKDAEQFNDMFSNIVFMGMGEPLHNWKNVARACKVLTDEFGFGMGPRKITVSTSGLVPAIKKFGAENVPVNLAVSLNATTDEVRTKIMPVNKAYPIAELLAALREYPLGPRKKITIEYVMLAGINDAREDLARLPRLLSHVKCKINLIPYNENAGLGFKPPSREVIDYWFEDLNRRGVDTTVRWSKGVDIQAACGQLASSTKQGELASISPRSSAD